MSSISNMIRRGSVYYFRRRAPPDLQAVIGRKIIRESLGEREPGRARRLCADRAPYWEKCFEAERVKLQGQAIAPSPISPQELDSAMLLLMQQYSDIGVEWQPGEQEQATAALAKRRPVSDLSDAQIQEMACHCEPRMIAQDER